MLLLQVIIEKLRLTGVRRNVPAQTCCHFLPQCLRCMPCPTYYYVFFGQLVFHNLRKDITACQYAATKKHGHIYPWNMVLVL